MSEMSFEQMLEESFKTIRNGEVVEGTVIDVKPDEIVLNIGYKSDGIITRNEYTNEANVDLTTLVSVGDTMEAKVLKVNDGEGQVLLTYKRLAAEKGSKRLEEAFENKEVLTAKVAQVLDGGLCVIVDETRVFIPASLVSDSYEKDLSKYKDQDIEFVISEFNPKRRRIIGDRKQLLVAKKLEQQKELFAKIKVGDVMEGTVKNITESIYNFLIEQKIDKILTKKINEFQQNNMPELAKQYETSWQIIMNVLDEINMVLGEETISFEKYSNILKIGLKNSGLGAIPGTKDQVIFGDVDRSRSHKVRSVFIIGLNDGVFPGSYKQEGFFNDKDREKLKNEGLELAKGTEEKLYDDNFNIYKAFTTAEENLYLSYASSDIDGKAIYIN